MREKGRFHYKLENPFEHFDYSLGSKVWPSSDPNDSPFDKYTCNYCGKKFSIQMCGSRHIDEPSFRDRAKESLREHLMYCKDFIWD